LRFHYVDLKISLIMSEQPKIIFVYNADSGVFNLLGDIAHKIFSPQTYQCNLCAITHGNFGMRDEWRAYLKTLKVPFEFLHADEFKAKYKIENMPLPAIFRQEESKLELLIDSHTINKCNSIDDLTQIIDMKVNQE
ncbi:MAG TPA: hypothetical protein VEF04_17070, partial [Blastocatellia bacterium]|nr:hypothetical protein [Blastocatellia bacterium]